MFRRGFIGLKIKDGFHPGKVSFHKEQVGRFSWY